MAAWKLRPARYSDADTIGAINYEGFESYREFAPDGWEPPSDAEETGWVRDRLGQLGVWCLVAEEAGEIVGHVGFMPATISRRPTGEQGLCHFWMLFVRRSHWGTGVAAELHAAAIAEATNRGFTAMRLYTPAGQARARRFYEREGWHVVGAPVDDPDFGLPVVEYRRAVRSG